MKKELYVIKGAHYTRDIERCPRSERFEIRLHTYFMHRMSEVLIAHYGIEGAFHDGWSTDYAYNEVLTAADQAGFRAALQERFNGEGPAFEVLVHWLRRLWGLKQNVVPELFVGQTENHYARELADFYIREWMPFLTRRLGSKAADLGIGFTCFLRDFFVWRNIHSHGAQRNFLFMGLRHPLWMVHSPWSGLSGVEISVPYHFGKKEDPAVLDFELQAFGGSDQLDVVRGFVERERKAVTNEVRAYLAKSS